MKKTLTTITLAIVMTFTATATFAGDGIMISDRNAPTSCGAETARTGIMLSDIGMAIYNLAFRQAAPCTVDQNRDGIIIFG